MEYLSIIIISILYVSGCLLTYAEEWREKWFYYPLGALLGVLMMLTWLYTCKVIADKDRILVLNLVWDSIQVAVYYGLPILLFGVRMDKMGYVGAGLIVAGIMCLKIR